MREKELNTGNNRHSLYLALVFLPTIIRINILLRIADVSIQHIYEYIVH